MVAHWSCPPQMGVHHRVLNIGRQMQKCGPVQMVYVGKAMSEDRRAATEAEFGKVEVMRPRVFAGPDWLQRWHYKFCFHWPWHWGEKVSEADRVRFEQMRAEYDVVWFQTLAAADCLGIDRVKGSIIDLDDLNEQKFSLMHEQAAGLREKIATKILKYKWKRRERQVLNRFDLAAVCSEDDKKYLGGGERLRVIPNGFEPPKKEIQRTVAGKMRLGFIGNLEYGPNFDGMEWFGKAVWDLIKKEIPEASMRIVGIKPAQVQRLDREGFEWLGFVEDTTEEFSSWLAMVVPLRVGGGTRLKIVEALSKKCPVVSTRVGAHGLEVTDQKDIILADEPETMAKHCVQLMQGNLYGEKIASAGWELFNRKYTWEVIGKAVREAVQVCAGRNGK
ncbi:MAG: glycosyltransferase [Planctomycetes bacterium]|nr:glycosyltransferase [Planctomycetota bacterium]